MNLGRRLALAILLLMLATLCSAPSAKADQLYDFSINYGANTVTFALPNPPVSSCGPGGCTVDSVALSFNGVPVAGTVFFFPAVVSAITGVADFNGLLGAPLCQQGIGGCAFFLFGPPLVSDPTTAPQFNVGSFSMTGQFSSWTPNGTPGYTVTITAAPEPSAFLLLGLGLAGILGIRFGRSLRHRSAAIVRSL